MIDCLIKYLVSADNSDQTVCQSDPTDHSFN